MTRPASLVQRATVVAFAFSFVAPLLATRPTGDFSPAPTSPEPAGGGPAAVVVADFNKDGNSDLAVANQGAGNLSVLLGSRSGDFTPAPTSPELTGACPRALAVGDFDKDGNPDLAVANHCSANVSILLGSRSGDFTPAPTSPEAAGASPHSVVARDFDKDGNLDLAVANFQSGDITILLGSRTGDFAPAPTSPEPAGGNPHTLAASDFDKDGNTDLAVVNISGAISILLGSSSADFIPAPTSPENVGPFAIGVVAHDFDKDGNIDLAVGNNGPGTVSILLGSTNGDFTPAPTSPEATGPGPFDLAAGDFNRDGNVDLAVAKIASNDVTILLGSRSGDFTPAPTSPEPAGFSPFAVAEGTFTKDGNLDLAVANSGSGTVTILLGQ